MIKFVYFDLGGVVFHFTGGLRLLANKYKREYSDFENVFRKYDIQVCIGNMLPQDLWKKYQEELDLPLDDFEFAHFWVSNFVAIPDTHTH